MSQKAPKVWALTAFAITWLLLLILAYNSAGSPRRALLAGGFLAVLSAWFFWRNDLRKLLRAGLPSTALAVVASAVLLVGAQLGGLHRELFPYVAWTMYAVPRGEDVPITWVKTVAIDCAGADHPFRVSEVLPDVGGQVGHGLSEALDVWSLRDASRNPADFPGAVAILERLGAAYESRHPDIPICAVAALVGNVPATTSYREAVQAPREVMRVVLDR